MDEKGRAPMQGYPPPSRRGWWQRAQDEFWSYSGRMRAGVLTGLIFAVLSTMCVTGIAGNMAFVAAGVIPPYRPDPTETPAPPATATFPSLALAPTATDLPIATATVTATATATPRPILTATPLGPRIVSGAFLGGTQDAFTVAYGQPTTIGGQPNYTLTTNGGVEVHICYCGTTTGQDGRQRVNTLSLNSSSSGWTSTLALSIFTRLYPPHSAHVKDFTDPQIGPIHVYQSPDLALTFPASAFTDSGNNGALLPPGTFSVACEDPNGVVCSMVVGE